MLKRLKVKYLTIANRLGKKAIIALLILAAVDVFVIAAPYYLRLIVPNIHLFLHVTEGDFTTFIAAIGWVTLITQLPGGWLADKVSSKKLTALASLSTGLLTIWWASLILFGQEPTIDANGQFVSNVGLLSQYYLIYIGWGISSTLIFWTPLWKLVSQQAKKEDQGLAYGVQGSFNGIIGLTLIWALGLGATALVAQDIDIAFGIYIYIVAAYLIVTAAFILWKVPEYTTEQKFALDFKTTGQVLKNPRIWLNAFFVMGMYMFQSVFAFYLLQFIQNIVADRLVNTAIPATVLLVVAGLRTYGFRFIVSGPVGHFADRSKSYIKLLILALGFGFIVTIIFLLVPGFGDITTYSSAAKTTIFVFLLLIYLLAGILSWVMVTLRYATISELPTPKKSYASVNALISFVAFSPDAWFYTASAQIGNLYTIPGERNTSQLGYTFILIFAISVAIFGWLCGLTLYFWNKRELKKLGKTDFRWREIQNA